MGAPVVVRTSCGTAGTDWSCAMLVSSSDQPRSSVRVVRNSIGQRLPAHGRCSSMRRTGQSTRTTLWGVRRSVVGSLGSAPLGRRFFGQCAARSSVLWGVRRSLVGSLGSAPLGRGCRAVGWPTPVELARAPVWRETGQPDAGGISCRLGVVHLVPVFDMFSVFLSLAVVLHSYFPAPWPPPVRKGRSCVAW